MIRKNLLTAALVFACVFFGMAAGTQVIAQTGPAPGANPNQNPGSTLTNQQRASIIKSRFKDKMQSEVEDGVISAGQNEGSNIHSTGTNGFITIIANFPFAAFGWPQTDSSGQVTYSGGALQTGSEMIAYMYSNPAAGTGPYLADLMNSTGIATPAYAQGVGLGFASLTPILEAWKVFRNIAYYFFIIVVLVLGFMIMFRQKVGQTAVTAQQAIPNVIVSLLAVSFSYAIAGFLIDLMNVAMFFLISIFSADGRLIQKSLFEIMGGFVIGATGETISAVSNFVESMIGNSFLADAASLIGGFTFLALIAIAVIFGVCQLFIELLKTYITIVLSIVMSPLLLMTNAIPGRNTFGPWVKNLAANLATFPIVLIILIIYSKIQAVDFTEGGFNPPYLLSSGNAAAISTMLGVGMLLIITDLVKQAKKALGATGGVFEQFGQNFANALKVGWNADQPLIPGMGFTKLSNYGISGKNAFGTTMTGVGAVAGGLGGIVPGALTGYAKGGARGRERFFDYARMGARATSDLVGSPLMKEDREKRGKVKVNGLKSLQERIQAYQARDYEPPAS
jgi:hypothetical protein